METLKQGPLDCLPLVCKHDRSKTFQGLLKLKLQVINYKHKRQACIEECLISFWHSFQDQKFTDFS